MKTPAVFVLLVCVLHLAASSPSPSPSLSDFDRLLADANRLAAEQSWSLAAEAYIAALAVAPTDNANDIRPHQLARQIALNHTAPIPDDFALRRERYGVAFESLQSFLTPYGDDQPFDAFALTVVEAQIDLGQRYRYPVRNASELIAKAATRFAAGPASPATATQLLTFLRAATVKPHLDRNVELLTQLAPLLRQLQRHITSAEDRAWLALTLAQIDVAGPKITVDFLQRWNDAIAATRDTTWALPCDLAWFVWRVEHGWSETGELGQPQDLDALLTEAKSLQSRLTASPAPSVDRQIASRLTYFIQQWQTPALRLRLRDQFLPGAPIEFAYASVGATQLTCSLYRFAVDDADLFASLRNSESKLPQRLRINRWTVPLSPATAASPTAWQSGVHQLSASLAPGFYALVLEDSAHQLEQRATFTVSSLRAQTVLSTGDPATNELFLSDATSGQPAAHVSIQGRSIRNDESLPWSITSDAAGRATGFPLPAQPERWSRTTVLGLADGQPFQLSTVTNSADRSPVVADVFLDRPLYQPGETVHWKIILRQRHGSHWSIPREHWKISFQGNDDTPFLALTDVALDPFGAAHGAFNIPRATKPQSLQLELASTDGQTDAATNGFLARIDHYVPPALTVALSSGRIAPDLRPGGRVHARVQVNYLSGSPASDCPVQLTLSSRSSVIVPFIDQLNPARISRPSTPEFEDLPPTQLTARTDAHGTAEFDWPLPANLAPTATLQLNVVALPPGGQPVARAAEWRLTPSGYFAHHNLEAGAAVLAPGQSYTLTGHIFDHAGQPAPLAGVVEWVQIRWQGLSVTPAGVLVRDADLPPTIDPYQLPPNWTRLFANYVAAEPVATNLTAGTDGAFTTTFTPSAEGLYRLRILDAQGAEVSVPTDLDTDGSRQRWQNDSIDLVVAAASPAPLALPPRRPFIFGPNQITVGQPARVLIVPPTTTRATVTLAHLDGHRSTIHSPSATPFWQDLSSLSATPGLARVIVSSPDSGAASHAFHVVTASPLLQVNLTPPASRAPGETATLQLTVSDPLGQPAPASVALAVADQAVLDLLGQSDRTQTEFATSLPPPFVARAESPPLEADPMPPMMDSRPGALILAVGHGPNPAGETIMLSAFSVGATADGEGYYASSTLSGSRIMAAQSKDLPEGGSLPVHVRRHFASTAAWFPDLRPDAAGAVSASFPLPDNLTQWHVTAFTLGEDPAAWNLSHARFETTLPFQARLQTPRFLIAGDTAELSAQLVNTTDQPITASVALTSSQPTVTLAPPPPSVDIAAHAESHRTWTARATAPGSTTLHLSAQSPIASDAMEVQLPIHEDGIVQTLAASARLDPAHIQTSIALTLPPAFDPARTTASVSLTTTPAVALLDALPYLIDYPYGCVEQTVSRFLPAVIVRQTLTQLGLDSAAVEARITSTAPSTPGFSALDDVFSQSIDRLTAAQSATGGFGWWPNSPSENPWMTAYVGWALALAHQTNIPVPLELLGSVIERCETLAADSDQTIENRTWAAWACSTADASVSQTTLTELLDARAQLSTAGRAVLAAIVAHQGSTTDRALMLRNLQDGHVSVTEPDGTFVHWGRTDGHWRAIDSATESTALTVLALLALEPDHPLIEPAVRWLVLQRSSHHWESTRDTTFAVLALSRYLAPTTSAAPASDLRLQLALNGQPLPSIVVAPSEWLTQPATVRVPADLFRAGVNQLELRRLSGTAPVYATAVAQTWAPGETVQPATHRVALSRDFERQIETATLAGSVAFRRAPLAPFGAVAPSEEVIVHVRLHLPHELGYLRIAVPKPAGCEPLNPLSGWDAEIRPATTMKDADAVTIARPLYREEHDDHAAFFIDHLEAGDWEIVYRLRAVTGGDYRALPATVEAMYVPSIAANSDARRLRISTTVP